MKSWWGLSLLISSNSSSGLPMMADVFLKSLIGILYMLTSCEKHLLFFKGPSGKSKYAALNVIAFTTTVAKKGMNWDRLFDFDFEKDLLEWNAKIQTSGSKSVTTTWTLLWTWSSWSWETKVNTPRMCSNLYDLSTVAPSIISLLELEC